MTKAAKPKNVHAEALGRLSDAKRTPKQREELARKGGIAKASKMQRLEEENRRLHFLLALHGIQKTHDDMQK